MGQRPKVLTMFSVIFVAVALSFPIQLMLAHDHQLDEWGQVFHKLTYFNYMIMAMSIVTAIFMRDASRHLFWALPIMVVTVFWNNYVVGSYGYDFSMQMTWMASLAFAALSGSVFATHAYQLMKYPEKRWWLRPKRVHAHLEATLLPYVGDDIRGKTYDISETGVFLPLKDTQLKLGDHTTVQIRLSQTNVLKAEAQVARVSTSRNGAYPAGLGLQFVGLSSNQRVVLKELVAAY